MEGTKKVTDLRIESSKFANLIWQTLNSEESAFPPTRGTLRDSKTSIFANSETFNLRISFSTLCSKTN